MVVKTCTQGTQSAEQNPSSLAGGYCARGSFPASKGCNFVQAHLQAGATYYIVVSGYQADAGAFQMNITTANGSFVPSLPVKGRYAVAQASSIAASGVINSTVTGKRQRICFSAKSAYSLSSV